MPLYNVWRTCRNCGLEFQAMGLDGVGFNCPRCGKDNEFGSQESEDRFHDMWLKEKPEQAKAVMELTKEKERKLMEKLAWKPVVEIKNKEGNKQ